MILTKYKRLKDNKVFTLELIWKVMGMDIPAFLGEDNRECLMVEQVVGSDAFTIVQGNDTELVAFNPDTNKLSHLN